MNLRAAIEKSLQATNAADRQRAIEREAFPAFHDAKIKERTDDLAAFMTETLITVTPGVAEVEAGFRAHRALEAYETAIAAGDQEAAAQSLLEFGSALTEAVPLAGRAAKASRFAPVLDKAKARIGKAAADLAGAGRLPDPLDNGSLLAATAGGGGPRKGRLTLGGDTPPSIKKQIEESRAGTPSAKDTDSRGAGREPDGPSSRRNPRDKRKDLTPEEKARLPAGPGWQPNRTFLTTDEFKHMPSRGRVDPQRVRSSQENIGEAFQGDGSGLRRTVAGTVKEVQADRSAVERIPPIMMVERNGHVYSLDHRRLVAFRRLGIAIPYVRVPYSRLTTKQRERIDKAHTINDNGAFIVNRVTDTRE